MAKGLPKSIEMIATRRRWTAQDAAAVLQVAAESGLPLWTFAERQGLDPHRLYRWRRQLGQSRAPEPMRFEEVVVQRADGGDSHRLELVLRSGHVVRVGSHFDADALRRLLAVLETC
jgi:transposase-like protein